MHYHELPKYPFKTGEEKPEMLIMRLMTTEGELREYPRIDLNNPQWDDAAWIRRSNEWWHQNIQRHLNRPNPTDPNNTARAPREPWSERELDNVKVLVERRLQEVDGLTFDDWNEIAKAHNKIFEGQTLRVGEKLIVNIYKNGGTPKKRTKEFVTQDQKFVSRSRGDVMTAYNRWKSSNNLVGGTEGGETDVNHVDEDVF
jgi:hypothetical protein